MTTQETQTSAQEQAPEQQTVQVGFEKALVMMNPEWRTAFTTEQVNQFRHYYHQAIQDMNILNNLNFQNAQQNFQAVLNTVIVTGNEEKIAELQRQQEAEVAHAAEVAANPIEDHAEEVVTSAKKGKTQAKAAAKGPKTPAKALRSVGKR